MAQGRGGVAPGPPAPSRRSLALRVGVAMAAAVTVAALYATGSMPSSDEVRHWGDDLGWAGPLVWPALFALVNFLVPWPLLAGATGLAFGTAAGTPLAVGGVVIAALLQMMAARHVAGPHLRARILERVPRIDAALERNGLLAIFYSRLLPLVPWGAVNYVAGVARVRARDVALGTVVGGTPKVFAYVALGGSFDDLGKPEAKVAIALLVALAVIGAVVARRQLQGLDREGWQDAP